MLFNKNKNKMIDVRELQKRGVVKIPKNDIDIPTNNEGFIEVNNTSKTQEQASKQSNADFFGFTNTTSIPTKEATQNLQPESSTYDKREVDQKITNLDNKIYKLEQRIELLEKKLNISQSANNVGVMGW